MTRRLLRCCWRLICLVLLLAACDGGWKLELHDTSNSARTSLTAEGLGDKVLLVNYWADWCKPCREEIPELNRFADSHRDRAVLLAWNADHLHGSALDAAAQKAGIAYTSLVTDPATVFALPEVEGLPTTIVIDAHGKVRKVLAGAQTVESLDAALNSAQQAR